MTITRILTLLGRVVAGAVDDAICFLEFADRRMLGTQLVRLQKHLDCVFLPGTSEDLERLPEELKTCFDGGSAEFGVSIVAPGNTLPGASVGAAWGDPAREHGGPHGHRAGDRAPDGRPGRGAGQRQQPSRHPWAPNEPAPHESEPSQDVGDRSVK